MSTGLARLLESIDPIRTYDENARRADDAVNSFHFAKGRIGDWEEFRTCLIEFFRHVESRVLRMRGRPYGSDWGDFDWHRCAELLKREYGRNGDKAAFEIARTGNEGGLYAVLRKLARGLAEKYSENEASARIYEWWNGLSLAEQFAAMEEYLQEYGHLLPSELTEGSAARIKANFPKVLEEHPRLLQRTRRVGR